METEVASAPTPAEDRRASPAEIDNPTMKREALKAAVWVGVVGLAVLAVYIAQPLLVIFGALVFAAMIDGGARLLGRVIKIGRGWRIGLVILLGIAFLVWLGMFAGSQISREAAELPQTVSDQGTRLIAWLRSKGFDVSVQNTQQLIGQLGSGVGTVTRAIGGVLGGLGTLVLIFTIGLYVALEPRLYERGLGWMLPRDERAAFHDTACVMAETMRKLMAGRIAGMVFEGFFTWAMLAMVGVPMAALLGIITGILAFIPNIGALIAGALMVMVGFSGGVDMGLWTIAIYFIVQTFDGYVLVPLIARNTVDLAPALVLGFQLIMGILFGVIGLFLADPLLAMIKVALERRAVRRETEALRAGP